jgi:uroporphyrinogen III methyltransferase/synthase
MPQRLKIRAAPASASGGEMLVVIAHGSHDARWCVSVERAIQAAQAGLGPRALRLAYMDCASPSLRRVVAEAARAGVRRVRVLPLFLAAEGHVDRNVRPLVEAVRKAHPSLAVELLPPLGQFPQFQETLRAIARNGSGHRPGTEAAAGALPARDSTAGTRAAATHGGVVYLVGAGPGDPGLITQRGIECLQGADVVLYDYLVNPALLEHAPPTAELVPLGRRTTGRGLTPAQITRRMIEEAARGRTVVRLKAGDPSVFARGADEEGALREAGMPYEIVPGITAGLAVAAYCEIPITHHDDASAVALVTGHERDEKATSNLDYGALASFPGTLVFYMGVTRAEEWSAALIAHGKSPDTPVAIVRWCTRAEQQRVCCTLGTVATVIAERRLRPPAVIVVGDVVARAPERAWFDARPLFGVRVLVPGTPAASQALRDRLTHLGADAVIQPAIRIAPPADWGPVDAALLRFDRYDWLVFSSANAVDALLRRLLERGGDIRRLGRMKVAAIGEGAADRLACFHVRADLVPGEFDVESLARSIAGRWAGARVLLVRSSRGSEALADALARRGAVVDQVAAYGSSDVIAPDPDVAAALAAGEIGWIAITSSAAARSLVHLYGDALHHARLATIGPRASATLRALGYRPAAEASPRTTAGLVETILRVEASGA